MGSDGQPEDHPDRQTDAALFLRRRARYRRFVATLITSLALLLMVLFVSRGLPREFVQNPSPGSEPVARAAANIAPAPTVPVVSPAPEVSVALTEKPEVRPAPLLILGFELPSEFEPTLMERWSKVRRLVEQRNFEKADSELQDLGSEGDARVRDSARLVRALLWKEQGRAAAVKPVFADLVANAKTASVREHARSVLQ